ncbi:hypothetical protein Ssi02_56780 [Sinosporangium siamense]|uniref:Uncharacterized protein n=1 Tax=Sinosporangium siamense TaxID=1367973 RepID=A0A919VAI3_9ACTN|nr:hypothetical protein Ssi02_56780 [Sinosporangium siamense]
MLLSSKVRLLGVPYGMPREKEWIFHSGGLAGWHLGRSWRTVPPDQAVRCEIRIRICRSLCEFVHGSIVLGVTRSGLARPRPAIAAFDRPRGSLPAPSRKHRLRASRRL